MKLCVTSYNLQGLSTREARLHLNHWINNFSPRIDVLYVQEHKIRDHLSKVLQNEIWREAIFAVAAAADGVHAQRNDLVPAGRGGLFTTISPRIVSQVTDSRILLSRRDI